MIEYIIIFQLITLIGSFIYTQKKEIDQFKYYVPVCSLISALVAVIVFILHITNPATECKRLYDFLSIGQLRCSIGLLSDSLSITASCVVCIISAMSNFYSIGYVRKNIDIFLCHINIFALLSVIFAASGNLLQLFIILELMCVFLYLFTAFDNKKESINIGMKITSFHKLGDVGMIISLISINKIFGSLNFDDIGKFSIQNDLQMEWIEFTALIMFASIFIKTAQICSTTWLKNATQYSSIPASALVHASPFVTSGVFIMIRLQNIFECNEFVQNVVITAGLSSSLICSIKAVFAKDIDNIFTYSTCANVGLMIVACGFSFCGAAIMIFVTHAFSKALLFFVAGSVIHSLSGEKSMDFMGGLQELLPRTYLSFAAAIASIVCFPLLSSYYAQKVFFSDIINSELPIYYVTLICSVVISILTSVYMIRTIYRIFHGEIKANETIIAYLNETEGFIINTMYLSVFFAIFSGVIFYYVVYTNIIWKDVFAFSYIPNTQLAAAVSFMNLIGIAFAIMICSSIKSIDSISPLNLYDFFGEATWYMRKNIEEKTQECVSALSSAAITKIDFCKSLESKLKPGASFICFLLLVFLCLTAWVIDS